MKRCLKLSLVSVIVALSIFSYVYVYSDVSGANYALVNQSHSTEFHLSDVRDSESKSLLPETKIIKYLSEKVVDLFASVVSIDN